MLSWLLWKMITSFMQTRVFCHVMESMMTRIVHRNNLGAVPRPESIFLIRCSPWWETKAASFRSAFSTIICKDPFYVESWKMYRIFQGVDKVAHSRCWVRASYYRCFGLSIIDTKAKWLIFLRRKHYWSSSFCLILLESFFMRAWAQHVDSQISFPSVLYGTALCGLGVG